MNTFLSFTSSVETNGLGAECQRQHREVCGFDPFMGFLTIQCIVL